MDKKELLKNKLFQPLKIKNFVLKNRFVLAPMALNTSTDDGIITDDDLAYAQRRSHSAPMAITGGTYINKYAQLFENGFANDRDEVLPGLTQMAKVMKKDGNLAILQIAHSWRFSIASLIRYKKVYGPSAGVFLTPFEHEVTELTIEEIEGIIQDFENAV